MQFWQRQPARFGLALDIGTSSVSGALFSFHKSHTASPRPYVHEVYRSLLDTSAGIDAHMLSRHAIRGVREVYEKSLKKSKVPPEEIIVGLSAPFYISKSVRISKPRKDPDSLITQQEIEDLTMRAEADIRKSLDVHMGNDLEFFTKSPGKILVNGYRMPDPIGKNGQTIEVVTRLEANMRSFREKIEEFLRGHRRETRCTFTSIPTATFRVLNGIMDTEAGMVFVDIGGEITEVSAIQDRALESVVSIPTGSGAIIRKIAESFHLSFHDALFTLRRYTENTLEDALTRRIEVVVESAVSNWRLAVSRELEQLFRGGFSPEHIVLSGGGSLLLKYKRGFPQGVFRTPAQRDIPVSVIQPHAIQEFFENPSYFMGPEDFGLACLTLLPFLKED
jgi:cell division ATPase FtsA